MNIFKKPLDGTLQHLLKDVQNMYKRNSSVKNSGDCVHLWNDYSKSCRTKNGVHCTAPHKIISHQSIRPTAKCDSFHSHPKRSFPLSIVRTLLLFSLVIFLWIASAQ